MTDIQNGHEVSREQGQDTVAEVKGSEEVFVDTNGKGVEEVNASDESPAVQNEANGEENGEDEGEGAVEEQNGVEQEGENGTVEQGGEVVEEEAHEEAVPNGKADSSEHTNGHTNGHANGHANGDADHHEQRPQEPQPQEPQPQENGDKMDISESKTTKVEVGDKRPREEDEEEQNGHAAEMENGRGTKKVKIDMEGGKENGVDEKQEQTVTSRGEEVAADSGDTPKKVARRKSEVEAKCHADDTVVGGESISARTRSKSVNAMSSP